MDLRWGPLFPVDLFRSTDEVAVLWPWASGHPLRLHLHLHLLGACLLRLPRVGRYCSPVCLAGAPGDLGSQ